MFIFKENGPSHCKDNHVHFQRKQTYWTYLSLQCEGPCTLKINMFIFKMWRSVFTEIEHPFLCNVKVRFSEIEHAFLYNVKVHFLWKWTSLFQRKQTFTIVKFNMFNFSDNGPPMMTDMKLCYWLWTFIQLLFTHFLYLVSSRRISYNIHIQ
jgi:hypothetical protein